MAGAIRPTLGGILSYSYRTYVTDSFTAMGASGTKTGTSGAIDFGITAGVDIALNERFAIGADLKYMFNISSNINGDTQPGASSPEKLNYYILGVAAKMAF
jgi:outer membrane protein W